MSELEINPDVFLHSNGLSTERNVVVSVMRMLGADDYDFRLRDRLIIGSAGWIDKERREHAKQLAAALAERDSANAQRLNELKDLLSCVDNVDCFCIDPPQDRGEDADNYENHASYCPDYLYGYIKSLISAPTPLTPDAEAI